jgi:hypothetical protein
LIFANPTLVWAAIAAATIPLILHFFLRKPQVTAWGSNFILKIAFGKIQRRRKIEKWLLLLLRVFAIGLVGFAAAGPFASEWIQDGQTKERWIIIDNGATSAEIRPDKKNTLEKIKQEIVESIGMENKGNRIAIVLASVPARVLVEPTTNHEAVTQAIQRVFPQEVPCDIPAALDVAFPKQEEKNAYRQVEIWSGFRRGSLDLEKPLETNLANRAEKVTLIATRPLLGQPTNYVLKKSSLSRTATEDDNTNKRKIKVEIFREGAPQQKKIQISFQNINGELISNNEIEWNENVSEKEFDVDIQIEKNSNQALQAILETDAQPLDNKNFNALGMVENPKVTILGRKSVDQDIENLPASSWIYRAIESTGMTAREIDAETISIRPPLATDTIILTRPDLVDQSGWTWLQNFASDGGVLIITPASEAQEQIWAADIERLLSVPIRSQTKKIQGEFRLASKQPRVGPLSLLGAELEALTEPVHINTYIPLETTDAAAQSILELENGKPLMCWAKPKGGTGVVAILGVSPVLSWSDLPVKPLMVPLFQELIRGGRMLATQQQDIRTGFTVSLGRLAADGLFVPPPQSNATTIQLDSNGRSEARILNPGIWTLETKNGNKKLLAVNIQTSSASIEPLFENAVRGWFAPVNSIQFRDENQEKTQALSRNNLEPLLIQSIFIIALICAITESILSRNGSPRQPQKINGSIA